MSDKEEEIKRHDEWCEATKLKINLDGPWAKEPNSLRWEYFGLECMIFRDHILLHLCGYVGIPPSHPFYGKQYNDPGLEHICVHGGLTYAGRDRYGIIWWFGFDCAHLGDFNPGTRLGRAESYKTFDYVKDETNRLAEQLSASLRPEIKIE